MNKKITRVSVLKKNIFDDMVKQHQSNILISWYEILIMPINENSFPARPTNNTLIAALLKNDTDDYTYTLMIAGGEAHTEYMIMNSPVMHQSAINQMRKSAYKWHLSDCNVKAKPIKKSKEKCGKSAKGKFIMDKKSISVEAFAIDMDTYINITKGIVKSCEIKASSLGYARLFQVADILKSFTFTAHAASTDNDYTIQCVLLRDDDDNYIVLVVTNSLMPADANNLTAKLLINATALAKGWLSGKSTSVETENPAERRITERESMVGAMMAVYLTKFPICFDLRCVQEYHNNADLANGIRKYSDMIYSAKQATGLAIHTFGQAYVVYDTIVSRIWQFGFVAGCSMDDILHIMKMIVSIYITDEDVLKKMNRIFKK